MECVLALVNREYGADGTFFDPKMDAEEYCNEYDVQPYDDGPVG